VYSCLPVVCKSLRLPFFILFAFGAEDRCPLFLADPGRSLRAAEFFFLSRLIYQPPPPRFSPPPAKSLVGYFPACPTSSFTDPPIAFRPPSLKRRHTENYASSPLCFSARPLLRPPAGGHSSPIYSQCCPRRRWSAMHPCPRPRSRDKVP